MPTLRERLGMSKPGTVRTGPLQSVESDRKVLNTKAAAIEALLDGAETFADNDYPALPDFENHGLKTKGRRK